jgi:hypothetical protein
LTTTPTARSISAARKRLATADERIVCYARDGGCTKPNCTAPGYHCAVHHCPDWTRGGATDADSLFFACDPDHSLLTDGHWKASVSDTGRLDWTDGASPPEVNHAHHPEELLHGNTDPPEGTDPSEGATD